VPNVTNLKGLVPESEEVLIKQNDQFEKYQGSRHVIPILIISSFFFNNNKKHHVLFFTSGLLFIQNGSQKWVKI